MKTHRVRDHFPSHVLARIKTSRHALSIALFDWDNTFQATVRRCPILDQWVERERTSEPATKTGGKTVFTSERIREIGFLFEESAELHLPFRRRPNLTEYDSRRDSVVNDRYYFGIYRVDAD